MLFAPPRHGKTELGLRYHVHRFERDPTHRSIVASYGQKLADKISRKARKLCRARGIALSKERVAADDWETEAGGGLRAVGVGGAVTGMGAHFIDIDDPVKNRQEANSLAVRDATWDWYRDDIYTRMEPGAAIFLRMTRWHEDDLAGRILASEDGPNWTVVKLPALAEDDDPLGRTPGQALCPERFPEAKLAEYQMILGRSFHALYQQRPTAAEGGQFKREWFNKIEDSPPPRETVSVRWRNWDCASTQGGGDYTAGVRFCKTRDGRFWVEHVQRGQWSAHNRDQKILATANSDPRGTRFHREQEPGSSGRDAGEAFARLLAGYIATFTVSTGSKEDRAEAYAAQLEAGNVSLVRGAWIPAFISEHCDFPNGTHDDQVDAASGGFHKCAKSRRLAAT
jgi:predicted phage terminase large subunit-like protein